MSNKEIETPEEKPRTTKRKDELLDIIDRAIGCLVCAAITDPMEVVENTLRILKEASSECNES